MLQQRIPFHLQGSSPKWQPPKSTLSWWATLNYLAKVDNDGQQPLDQFLDRLSGSSFTIILISQPSPLIVQALQTLAHRATSFLPIFITPDGEIPMGAKNVASAISVSPYNWETVLSQM